MTMPNSPPGLVVVDAGKRDFEHFEFNRGVLLALRNAGLPFRFVAMQSMHDAHAPVVDSHTSKSFASLWDALPSRWKSPALKLFSVVLALAAVSLARRTLLVLYATPAAHLTLALASRVIRLHFVVFVHAEIEFMAKGRGRPWLFGEYLISLALRCSSDRVKYLTFTVPAAECVSRIHGAQATVCPHPISKALLCTPHAMRSGTSAAAHRPMALVFFKGASDSACLRRLCDYVGRTLSINVNGCVCTIPDGSHVWPRIEPLRTLRRFLERDELESALTDTAIYLLAAAEDEYCFTASGLACSAASAGAAVLGCANPFMTEYHARYPAHFTLLRACDGDDHPLPLRPVVPLDNLEEVAQILMACILPSPA
jgi:hypothetical protein